MLCGGIRNKMTKPNSIFTTVKEALKNGSKGLSKLEKDAGEKMLQEFYEKEGDISDNDRFVALQYFSEDYVNSMKSAKSCFYAASEYKIDSPEHKHELKKSNDLVLRAEKDFESSLEISPLTDGFLRNRPRRILYDEVNERKTKIYLAKEFPSNYIVITPYYFRMLEAIQENDFELARTMSNEIKSFTSRKDRNIDFQDNLAFEYHGDAD